MFIKLLLLSVALVAIALIALGVKIFFQKGGEFPETKIGHNKVMRKNKIHCIKTQQVIIDKKRGFKQKKAPNCTSC